MTSKAPYLTNINLCSPLNFDHKPLSTYFCDCEKLSFVCSVNCDASHCTNDCGYDSNFYVHETSGCRSGGLCHMTLNMCRESQGTTCPELTNKTKQKGQKS